MILALETATKTGSVALWEGGLIGEYTLNIQRTHSERLMPAVVRILEDAAVKPQDLTALAVSLGPGSFTGLRIGIMTAKTLAWSLQIPLYGIPTLDALAWQLRYSQGLLVPLLDCRRERVYNALYLAKGQEEPVRQTPYRVLPVAELLTELEGYSETKYFFGDKEIVEAPGVIVAGRENAPSAAAIAALAQMRMDAGIEPADPHKLVPLYVQKSAAEARREEDGGSAPHLS